MHSRLCFGPRKACNSAKEGQRRKDFRLCVCSSKTRCSFFVKVVKSKSASLNGFLITDIFAEHNGCTGVARPTARQVSSSATAIGAIVANPRVAGKAVQHQLRAAAGLNVSQRMVYRARDQVTSEFQGDYEQGLQKLESLLALFCEKNTGSVYSFDVDSESRFDRAFVSHPFAVERQRHGQAVLGFDGAFMKSAKFNGTMLILVGRDGNNSNVPLAYALARSESAENCSWFVQHCKRAGINFSSAPLFTDRGSGLMSAFSSDSDIQLIFCTRHIIGNMKSKFKSSFNVDLQNLVWRAQGAESEEEFSAVLKLLEMAHKPAADYLQGIPPAKWCLHHHIGRTKLYGWRTTNFVESQNGAAVPLRFMSPYDFFNAVMESFMKESYERQRLALKWADQGKPVTPHAQSLFEESSSASAYHNVMASTPDVFFVQDVRARPMIKRRVNLQLRSCTCTFMGQMGVPCSHFVSALTSCDRMQEVYSAFDECYQIKNFAPSGEFVGVDLVLEEEVKTNSSVRASLQLPQVGRHRFSRITSRGEEGRRFPATRKCSRCKQEGHNRQSCDA